MSGHVVALGLGGGHGGRPGGVELDGADHRQIGRLLLEQLGGLLHQIHVRALARAEGGVGEHADLRVDAEGAGGLGGLQRDFGKLLGVRVEVDGAVGEHGHMVLEAHEERARDQFLARLGLDDLQGGAHGVSGGMHGTRNQSVGIAEHHQHGAEVAGVGQLLAGLLLGHALLGAQLAQFGHHRLEHVLVVHGLESGAPQTVQPQFPAAGQDGVLVAHDDEVHGLTFEQVIGRLDDAVLLAFGQHDGLLVALGLAEQVELEGVRRDRRGDVHVERGEHLVDGSVLAEGLKGQVLGGFVGEGHLRQSPDWQAVFGEGLFDGEGVTRLAAGHEDAEHRIARGAHALDGQLHGFVELVRPSVHGAHGQEYPGLQIGGDVRVELVGGRVVDVGFVGADDQGGVRAGDLHGVVELADDVSAGGVLVGAHLMHVEAGGQGHAESRIGGGEQDGGEFVMVRHGRPEHHGLVFGGQRIEHAIGDDVASIGAFGAGDVYTGDGHDVSFDISMIRTITHCSGDHRYRSRSVAAGETQKAGA